MSRRRLDRQGIHIERDVADSVGIEEGLDANVEGVYRIPSPARRRASGWVFLAGSILGGILVGWEAAVPPALLAAWNLMAAWPLTIDEGQALARAAATVEFPVGHASAAVTFHGWRSRPRWSVILYSASEPPDRRALVVIDGLNGAVIGDPFVEPV